MKEITIKIIQKETGLSVECGLGDKSIEIDEISDSTYIDFAVSKVHDFLIEQATPKNATYAVCNHLERELLKAIELEESKVLPFRSLPPLRVAPDVKDILDQIFKRTQQRLQPPNLAPQHRKITTHKVNPANDRVEITVLDQPGAGNANHLYLIEGVDPSKNPSWKGRKFLSTAILFQNGPIPEAGVNGVTQEVLLAIVKDRLEGFQNGKFACIENQIALDHINSALNTLLSRTKARMARGVEGSHKV